MKPAKVRRTVVTRVSEAVKAIALCHNVTPVYDAVDASDSEQSDTEADQQSQQRVTYQASSPDEVRPSSLCHSLAHCLVCPLISFFGLINEFVIFQLKSDTIGVVIYRFERAETIVLPVFGIGRSGGVDGERRSDPRQARPRFDDATHAQLSTAPVHDTADLSIHVGNQEDGHRREGQSLSEVVLPPRDYFQ